MATTDISPTLETKMRSAYERGRARRAAIATLPLLLLTVLAVALGNRPTMLIAIAFVLLLTAWIFLWRGQTLGKAVIPGVLAGVVPFAFSYCARFCGHFCTARGCMSLCMPLCTLGGALGGALVTRFALLTPSPRLAWTSGTALLLLTGSLGCACMGTSGIAGLLTGTLLGSLTAYALTPRKPPTA